MCLTGVGITKTVWESTTEECAWDIRLKKKNHAAGKQPRDLLPPSQVAQPLGSQKALLHLDGGLQKAFLARKCHLIPLHRRFHAGDREHKDMFKKEREREREEKSTLLFKKKTFLECIGGDILDLLSQPQTE